MFDWKRLTNIIPDEIKQNPEKITFEHIYTLIINIINVLLGIGAFIAFAMILYGGFIYLTSYGDENKTTTAKNTLTWSIVGIIVIMLAVVIVNFVTVTLLGSNYKYTK